MTTELQRAMARYEDARIQYKKAVLASLNGDAGGEGIRTAIRGFQEASSALRQLRGGPPRAVVAPIRLRAKPRPQRAPAMAFFRRLLNAG